MEDISDSEAQSRDEESKSKKRREKKKKKQAEKPADEKPKPVEKKVTTKQSKQSGQAKFILKRLQAVADEEERVRKQQEEEARRLEEERLKELERERIEQEKKERRKKKEKERKQKLKQEGKLLTKSQKEKRARGTAHLQIMIEQGATVAALSKDKNGIVAPKPRSTRGKAKKSSQNEQGAVSAAGSQESREEVQPHERCDKDIPEEDAAHKSDDAECHGSEGSSGISSEEEEEEEETWESMLENNETDKKNAKNATNGSEKENKRDVNTKDNEKHRKSVNFEDIEKAENEPSCIAENNNAEKHKVVKPFIADPVLRISTRRKINASEASTLSLRSPIICVMGHVDTGKTKLLDKLRNTHVQDGEAGGITQQIGVTNVPLEAIRKSVKCCQYMDNFEYKLSGLSIIDTPGHFSFRNLRSLGSSLCDMAILIVDIMHSIEPQTEESIKLLLNKKVPFVIALNKIDVLVDWKSDPTKSIKEVLELQSIVCKPHFEDLFKKTFIKFAECGINIALFWKNTDPTKYVSVVPTSARTGDGIGDLISYICRYSQERMAVKLSTSKELDATVMEVKVVPGFGVTIDVILVNGTLSQSDVIVVAGLEGPIVSQVRALLTPQPMKEMRVKGSYIHHDKITTTQGVKIAGPDLDLAIAGLPLYVAECDDEVPFYKEELNELIKRSLGSFEKKDKGVYVQASTLGSLEALLDFLRQSKIPYFGINVGPVHKRDVISAMAMLDHNPMYSVILAFDVKIDVDAQQLADKSGIKIFSADIIYHLYDQYVQYEKDYRKKKADEFRHLAVFPCVLKILPNNVFKTRKPIIVGVVVDDGTVRIGTPLCVPSREGVMIGSVASIEINNKSLEIAKKGQEVCIKIVQVGEEAPKMVGRHFNADDPLVSKITRDSIDILKDYFREEVSKADWLLIKELKTTFGII